MPRHRTVMTPRERARWLLRAVVRGAGWLVLGTFVGAVTWAALRWAGATAYTAWWVAAVVAGVTAAAAGVAATLPTPQDPAADGPDTPAAS